MTTGAMLLWAMHSAQASETPGERFAAILGDATDDRVVLREARFLVDEPPKGCAGDARLKKKLARLFPEDGRVFPSRSLSGKTLWCDHRRPSLNVEGRRKNGDVIVRFGSVSRPLAHWSDSTPTRYSVALKPTPSHPLELWGAGDAVGVVHQAIARGLRPGIIRTEVDEEARAHVLIQIPTDAGDWSPDLYLVVTPGADGSIAELEYIRSMQFSRDVRQPPARPMALLEGELGARDRLERWQEHRSGLVCLGGCDGTKERVGALFGEVLAGGRLSTQVQANRSGRFTVIVFEQYPDLPRIAVYGDWEDFELRTGAHPTFVFDGQRWKDGEPMVVDAELGVLLSGPNPLGLARLPVARPDEVELHGFDREIDRFSPATPSGLRKEHGKVGELAEGRRQTTVVDWVEVPPGFSRLPAVDSERGLSYIWGTRQGSLAFLGVKGDTVTLLRHHQFDRTYRKRVSYGYTDDGAAKLERLDGSGFDHLLVYNGSSQAGQLGYRSLQRESDDDWAIRRAKRQRQIEAIWAERERARAARAAQPRQKRTLMDELLAAQERLRPITVTNSGGSRCAVSVYDDAGSAGSLDLAPGASETLLVDVTSSTYSVGSRDGCHTGLGVH